MNAPCGSASFAHDMPFGPTLGPLERRFRLWAPLQRAPRLEIEGEGVLDMAARGEGWHAVDAAVRPGTRYRYRLDDGTVVPDPASRCQPEGPSGWSVVVDPRTYRWQTPHFAARPWHETVLYELHVGTFTPEGTWLAATRRLEALARLGVTTLEVMPIATFPGRHGWGYDGVMPFAPHPAYGRPDDAKTFVDAAHGHGLSVILDVVYNHAGPEGNILPSLAPAFSTRHRTPWGDGVNLDGEGCEGVRSLIIENALYWLREYRFDGLRLDAVHALVDDSPVHILAELAGCVRSTITDRPIRLILESDRVETALITPALYDGTWNDDIHHALHVAVTGETGGYLEPFSDARSARPNGLAAAGSVQSSLARALAGQAARASADPDGQAAATPTVVKPTAFVTYLQNHDQIGNRPLGDRIAQGVATEPAVRAATAVVLLGPWIPLLFMGEEWAASAPFPFFCDLAGDELRDAVRKGRRALFAEVPGLPGQEHLIPDPLAAGTVASAILDWTEVHRPPHRETLDRNRRLLAVRFAEIVPRLTRIGAAGRARDLAPGAITVNWPLDGGGSLDLAANLSPRPLDDPSMSAPAGRVVWTEGETQPGRLGPWAVIWSVDDPVRESS